MDLDIQDFLLMNIVIKGTHLGPNYETFRYFVRRVDLDIQEFLLMNVIIKIVHYMFDTNVYWDRSRLKMREKQTC